MVNSMEFPLLKCNPLVRRDSNIWSLNVKDNFDYSDGEAAEEYLKKIIKKAKDLTSQSLELEEKIVDWVSEYHFSSQRANLLRGLNFEDVKNALELGSGCGAITRYLGELGINVDAVEGNLRRAEITRLRCGDLENVTVINANFNELTFPKGAYDAVFLTGVLEYAKKFLPTSVDDKDAVISILSRAKLALKKEGLLFIATENRMGLKYWMGASEDHYGQPHIGLYGYPQDQGIRTYDKREWEDILKKARIKCFRFCYPFPDYKLPRVILSDSYVRSDEYAHSILYRISSRDYVKDWQPRVDEFLLWESLHQSGYLEYFANSFFIIISESMERLNKVIPYEFVHFSDYERKPIYRTVTMKLQDKDYVVKKKMTGVEAEESNEFVKQKLSRGPYIRGPLLSSLWLHSLVGSDDTVHFEGLIQEYYRFLLEYFNKREELNEALDFLPFNIIVDDTGSYQVVDKEWIITARISPEYVLFRALLYFSIFHKISLTPICKLENINYIKKFIEYSFSLLSIQLGQKIDQFIELEERVQGEVSLQKSPNPIRSMLMDPFQLQDKDGVILELHRGYRAELERVEKEKSEIHRGYRAESERVEKEKSEIHRGYRAESERVEKEKSEIHRGYREELELKERELDEIKNSISWRLVKRYRQQVDRWLPQHTRGGRLYRLCILAPIVLFREGIAAFFRKIAERLQLSGTVKGDVTANGQSTEGWWFLTFPRFDEVKVSIVIPVYNQSRHTFRCLQSLLEHTEIPYEVIVVDNASRDDTSRMLAAMEGIQVIRNQDNKGFVAACNQGAEAGKGNYYLFLNNDTEVTRGWLEAMLKPFEDEKVGIVGAKLVYPDGRLQEAGNIIWEDGTGWNYGRGDDPDLPQYSYMKEVDYCSAACLLIHKNLWLELGGFDQKYAPAYYEDTDLCFAARQQGYKVIYQPEARVVHHEGVSAGTDINSGYKRYQQVNRDKFREKWREVLKREHFKGPEELYLARERGFSKRVLVVDHYVPTFDMDSGSLRMFSLVKIFRDLGYKVIFWPENRAFHEPYTRELQRMGIETLYGDINFGEYLKNNGNYIDLILLSRPHIAVNFMDAAKTLTNARIIYDTVDLHFVREERKARLEAEEKARLETEKSAREWKSLELFLAHQADETLVVSPMEKEVLEREGLKGRVSVISNVHALEPCYNSFEQRQGLMFIGGFTHPPNEDGIVWFVESIFPSIQKKLPGIHLYIVGSHPTDKVRSLSSANVAVTGYVKDVSPYFEKARVFVSPLRYGAGVKGKIGQSMAYGLPVVTTSLGAEGIGFIDGYNALIADGEDKFADKTVKLYQDRNLWEILSANARALVDEKYSPDAVKRVLSLVLEKNK